MSEQLEVMTLNALNDLPWGTHICHFYEDKQELADVVLPYLQAGLRNNERCLWICSKPLTSKVAVDLFRATLPQYAGLLETKQIEIVPYHEWYLTRDRKFDIPTVIRQWDTEISGTLKAGYKGLRVAGNLPWTLYRKLIVRYEERFCAIGIHSPIIAMCSYPIQQMTVTDIIQVSYVHQFALVKHNSAWQLIKSARYRDVMWQSLLDTLSKGMLAIDNSGTIITATNMCLEFFGCASFTDLGANMDEFAERFKVQSLTGQILPTNVNTKDTNNYVEDCWKVKSPAYGDVKLLVTVRKAKPNAVIPDLFLLVFHDITNLRRLGTIQNNFLQVMSHELRNPVQTIKAIINLIDASITDQDSPMARYLRLADTCVDQIIALIEDLLAIRQIEHDDQSINIVPTDFMKLVQNSLEPYLSNSQHIITCLFNKKQSIPVMVDPVRAQQIIANILHNAIKYTPKGKKIWLDFTVSSNYAIFAIEDEGIGVPCDELELIFDQFYRATNARGHSGGIGLGLYVSRCLARMHGGDLWAEASPHGGTIMKFSLPVLNNETYGSEKTSASG